MKEKEGGYRREEGLQDKRGHWRNGTSETNHIRRDECQESNCVTLHEETKVPESNRGQR